MRVPWKTTKLSWDNPEKTRICVDDGKTRTVVPTTGGDPLWVKVRREVKRRKLTIREHVAAKIEPQDLAASYQEVRAFSYPSLTDLADALYWRERGDPEKFDQWLAACDAVKKALPKTKEQA